MCLLKSVIRIDFSIPFSKSLLLYLMCWCSSCTIAKTLSCFPSPCNMLHYLLCALPVFLYGLTCSRLVLYWPCPGLRISRVSEQSSSALWGVGDTAIRALCVLTVSTGVYSLFDTFIRENWEIQAWICTVHACTHTLVPIHAPLKVYTHFSRICFRNSGVSTQSCGVQNLQGRLVG